MTTNANANNTTSTPATSEADAGKLVALRDSASHAY